MKMPVRGLALSAALLATCLAAMPADARWGRHYHRDRIDVDAGDIIAGVALIGIIAAIANAGDRPRRDRRDREDERYDDRSERQERQGSTRQQADSRDAAADSCIFAVEDRAGERSRVDRIDRVERDGDGWLVEGIVRRPDANAYAVRDDFRCVVSSRGDVRNVSIGGGV